MTQTPSERTNEQIAEELSKDIHSLFGKSKGFKFGNPSGGLVALAIMEALDSKSTQISELQKEIEILRSGEVADHLQKGQLMRDKVRLEGEISKLKAENENLNKELCDEKEVEFNILSVNAKLLEEVARLKKIAYVKVGGFAEMADNCMKENESLKSTLQKRTDENAKLREDLRKYGKHEYRCKYDLLGTRKCSCGLDEALTEGSENA